MLTNEIVLKVFSDYLARDVDFEVVLTSKGYTVMGFDCYRQDWNTVSCMHCADAPCVMGCPCGCLTKDAETGFTLYDTTNCIGCHSCAMACPYGVPGFGPDGKMRKCDACIERQRAGMLPACVKVCPTGALVLLTEDEFKARQAAENEKKARLMMEKQFAR